MKTHKIIKKTVLKESIKVYDFTVKDDHHYILENGVLSHNSYVPTKDLGGGNGIKYAASNIIMLSKSKDNTDEVLLVTLLSALITRIVLSKKTCTFRHDLTILLG